MNIKHRALLDSVNRLLHYNQELSRIILGLVNNPDNPHYKDGKLPRSKIPILKSQS